MSWELMREERKPCSCGKGYIVEQYYMDDWNRSKDSTYFECEECKKKNDEHIAFLNEQMKREDELISEIVSYFNAHYLEQWIAYFKDKKSKKAIWEIVYSIEVESCSLSSFYTHSRIINQYLKDLVRVQNIPRILQVLNIKDEIIENKLPEALKIYEKRRMIII